MQPDVIDHQIDVTDDQNWPTPTPDDELVPDPTVAAEYDVTLMTVWRWDHDPARNFPPKVQHNGRNHRFRSHLDLHKQRLWRAALKQRAKVDA